LFFIRFIFQKIKAALKTTLLKRNISSANGKKIINKF
jgi:hypothetical protein